eukprot:m.128381 g.128381  ORF g.128381 m.128381 type:complete len:249 (-) comp15825_c0_seq1:1685-2431(-)
MCLRSDHAIVDVPSASAPAAQAPTVDLSALSDGAYTLLDVRESTEATANPIELEAVKNIPLGDLLRQTAEQTLDKTLKYVCVCNVGYRSSVAVTQLNQHGYTAFSLQGGAAAISAPVAAWYQPQFVVVLTTCDPEKATLALSVATASQANGRATAMVCMAEAPLLFRQAGVLDEHGPRASELNIGEPFKAGAVVLAKFGAAGGRIFACKSCVKFHKLSYDKLETVALPMQAPDLVRMSCGAQGTVTFS